MSEERSRSPNPSPERIREMKREMRDAAIGTLAGRRRTKVELLPYTPRVYKTPKGFS